MRKLTACFCILLIAALPACTLFAGPANAPVYHKAEEICQLPVKANLLGISPDGSTIILDNKDRIEACRIDGLSGTVETLAPFAGMSYETNNFTLLNHKQLCWAKDGKTFSFMDSQQAPAELMLFKSLDFHVCALNGSGLSAKQVTNEDRTKKFIKGGRLIYSPSLAPGDGSIVFTAISSGWTDICRADIDKSNAAILYHSAALAYIECAALSDTVILCLQNGYQNDTNKLFLVGKDQRIIKQVDDAALKLGEKQYRFDIDSWSEDRRTLLLTRWNSEDELKGQGIDAYFILKFSQDFQKVQVAAFPVEPSTSDQGKRLGLCATLSPDGSYFVGCETIEIAGAKGKPSMKKLMLYQVADGQKTELYSSDGMFGFSSPLNGNHEAIFLMRNGKMLVWFAGGYKLFQLK